MELKFKKGDTVSFGSNNETIILTGESMYSLMDDAVFWIGLDIKGNVISKPQYELKLVEKEKPILTFDAF